MSRFKTQRVYGTIEVRILAKIRRDDDGCWLWLAGTTQDGYPQISGNHPTIAVHRWMYEWAKGPIPAGLQIDHLCHRPACVNPDHLEAVTGAENVRRRYAVVTHCKHGHERTPENAYVDPSGRRHCRPCMNERSRRYQRKGAA